MDKAQRDKLILIGLGIIVVVVVAYFGISPLGLPSLPTLRAEVAKLRTEEKTLQDAVRNAQVQVAGLDKIKKERETLEAQLRELGQRLPNERETPKILRSVETIAGKSGLQIREVKRRPTRAQELYAEIPLEVGVSGKYRDLLKFSEELGKIDRLVTLSEVQVQRWTPGGRGTTDETSGSVRAQMVAVVFQTLPDRPAADAKADAPPARR